MTQLAEMVESYNQDDQPGDKDAAVVAIRLCYTLQKNRALPSLHLLACYTRLYYFVPANTPFIQLSMEQTMQSLVSCKNCQHQFEGKYCNQCGQSADTHRLNFHFVWHDIQHGLFHFDKGIPYTLKELFTRPGHSIREFMHGKRIKHFKPLSLLILLASVYAFIFHFWHLENFFLLDTMSTSQDPKAAQETIAFGKKISDWMTNHLALITMVTLPIFALGSYLAFRKQGYNFVEHFVLNAFVAAQKMVIQLLILPFFFISTSRGLVAMLGTLATVLGFAISVWVYIQFFNKLSRVKTFFLTVLSYLISMSVLALCIGGAGAILVMLFHK